LLTSATESYSAALESYNYGVRNLLDVTNAQKVLAQARSAIETARYNLNNCRVYAPFALVLRASRFRREHMRTPASRCSR
jgi:outer membrane protein TolC